MQLYDMQTSDSYNNQKNSLFNTMSRFIGAVNNMDQTVMVPSLLRDVPLLLDNQDMKEAGSPNSAAYFQQENTDMYSSYVLLKSIRNDMECSVMRGKEKGGVADQDHEEEDNDLEKQFHFHLNGLHAVLSKLTRKADTLTTRYKEEIGCN